MTGDVFRVGADLGGHTLAFGTVRFRPGEIPELVCRCERPTPSGRDPESVLAALAEGVREVSRGLPVVGAGLVVPGMVDRERRLFLKGPNFPGWDGLPLARNLEALLRDAGLPVPVALENDANAYALGEGLAGAARGCSDYVVLTLGTGVGGGVVVGGRLVTGSHGMAGELGHLVTGGDLPCGCGGRGHLETLAGADGIEARARALGLPEDVRTLWGRREERAVAACLEPFLDALARGVASLVHLLAPEVVVLGGGIARGEGLVSLLRERTLPYLAEPYRAVLDLRVSLLGADAPLLGAAGLPTPPKVCGAAD